MKIRIVIDSQDNKTLDQRSYNPLTAIDLKESENLTEDKRGNFELINRKEKVVISLISDEVITALSNLTYPPFKAREDNTLRLDIQNYIYGIYDDNDGKEERIFGTAKDNSFQDTQKIISEIEVAVSKHALGSFDFEKYTFEVEELLIKKEDVLSFSFIAHHHSRSITIKPVSIDIEQLFSPKPIMSEEFLSKMLLNLDISAVAEEEEKSNVDSKCYEEVERQIFNKDRELKEEVKKSFYVRPLKIQFFDYLYDVVALSHHLTPEEKAKLYTYAATATFLALEGSESETELTKAFNSYATFYENPSNARETPRIPYRDYLPSVTKK